MLQITRTTGASFEELVSAVRCRLYAILPELTTTGEITLRNDNTARMVGQVGTVTNTAGAAGSLVDDTYYFAVQAVDENGQLGLVSDEETELTSAGASGSIALSWSAPAGGVTPTSYRVYVGTATGDYLGYFDATTTSFVITSVEQAEFTSGGEWFASSTGPSDPTTGDLTLKIRCAIGLTQQGKELHGVEFSEGLIIRQTVTTDRFSIIWEAV
jgi:hypothetical protein